MTAATVNHAGPNSRVDWLLIRVAARRDRLMVPLWLSVLVLVCFASAAATPALYSTDAERVQAAEAINASPGIVALYGPILDVHSTGELAMTKMTVLYAVLVAIMMLFVVRRHTRMDEESGQAELLAATGIKVNELLTAALRYGVAVSIVLGLLITLVNTVGSLPVAGSLAFGAAWAGIGLVATGLTALTCQLSPSARTCAAITSAVIGGLFVVRAVGDTTDASWLSWLSPFGWNTQLRAYSDPRWWVLTLYLALAAGLTTAAFILRSRRDLGAGVFEPRPGPVNGSVRLSDALRLNLRVHTPMLVGWTFAVGLMGLVFGAITPSFDAFNSEQIQELLARIGGEGAFRDTMLAAIISMTALIVTCFAISVITHGGNDEHDGRTEQVLATGTSRSRAFLATALVAVAGASWLLLVAGVTLALGIGTNSSHSFPTLVLSAIAQAPAMWVVIGLAVLCFAWRSRWSVLGWVILVVFATVGQIGELLNLPQWVIDLSPFTHSPRMPVASFAWAPALLMTGIAVLLLIASWWRYRTRDIG